MNKERRKRIAEAVEHINAARDILEQVMDNEQDAFDNLSEGLQCTDRGSYMEECVDTISEVLESLDDAVDEVEAL